MFSWLTVLKLAPDEHRSLFWGAGMVPVSASIPGWAGRMVVGLEAGKKLRWCSCAWSVSFSENEPSWETPCTELLVYVSTPGCDGFPSLGSKENCKCWGWEQEGMWLFLCLSLGSSTVWLPLDLERAQFPALGMLGQGRRGIPYSADKAVGRDLKQQERAKIQFCGVLGCSSVSKPCAMLWWPCGTPLMLCFR